MASFIKLDSSCVVQNGLNNTYRYSFNGSAVNFMNNEIAIQSISMYNSQFNVDSAAFGNNTFKLIVPTADTTSTITVSLADGYYDYSDINREIQGALIAAGAYLIDNNDDNVFYIQLVENSIYYASQIDFSPTPTTLPSGWSAPSSGLYSSTGTGLPTTTLTPRIVIDNAAFGSLLGLTAGTYPAVASTTATYKLSNITPQIHPSSSYVIRCDAIDNKFVPSGDIIAAFNRAGAARGGIIKYEPAESIWCSTINGPRSTLSISIYDQNERPVHFRDESVAIYLIIR